MARRLVIVESPFDATTQIGRSTNVAYARACVRHALLVGDAPIASHLLYTQPGILDDDVPEERGIGIAAGLVWLAVAHATVVYIDRGISDGMYVGIEAAIEARVPVEYRELGGLWRRA